MGRTTPSGEAGSALATDAPNNTRQASTAEAHSRGRVQCTSTAACYAPEAAPYTQESYARWKQ